MNLFEDEHVENDEVDADEAENDLDKFEDAHFEQPQAMTNDEKGKKEIKLLLLTTYFRERSHQILKFISPLVFSTCSLIFKQ